MIKEIKFTPQLIQKILDSHDETLIKELNNYLNNPIYSFVPRPNKPNEYDEQEAFVMDKFPGIAIGLGGNGSGKSACGAYKASRFILETTAPRPLTPFLIGSQDFDMVGSLWQEKYSKLIPNQMIKHITWRNRNRQFPREVILKENKYGCNWVLDFRSYMEGREQFQAISAGGFHLDELAPHEILIEILARCRDYEYPGSKIYTLTPLEPAPELEQLHENREREDVKKYWKFYRFNTSLNKTLPQSWYDLFFGSLPKDMVKTRMIGDFAHFEGLVYKEFLPSVHVINPIQIPAHAVHHRGIDFGWRASACIWVARAGNDWYVYNELQVPETYTEDFAAQINRVHWDFTSRQYGATYADWEDPEAMSRLSNLGIPCSPAKKNVQAGIETIRRKLNGTQGKPNFYVFANCENFIRQMRTYRWKQNPRNTLNPKPEPDEPVKHDDHLLDACRYAIYSASENEIKPWSGVTVSRSTRSFYG